MAAGAAKRPVNQHEELHQDEESDRHGGDLGGELPLRREVVLAQVQQHHDEEEQDQNRTGVDQDLEHADQVGLEQHVDAPEGDHGQDQAERCGDRVARVQHHPQGAGDGDGCKEVEEQQAHWRPPMKRTTAPVIRMFAIESGRIIFQQRSMIWS